MSISVCHISRDENEVAAEIAAATANILADSSAWIVLTQVMENYGAHAWDGKGECPQYWKAKGGNEYIVRGCRTHIEAMSLVASRMSNNHAWREFPVGSLEPAEWIKDIEDYDASYKAHLLKGIQEIKR
jgi:hypothetical protein